MVTSDVRISRRQVLTTLGAAAALFPLNSRGQTQTSLDKTGFLRVSSLVTGFPVAQLTGLSDPLFATFQAQAAVLLQIDALSRTTPSDGFIAAIAGTPLEPACQLLASAWYTGMLGAGRNAKVISYDDALAWPAAGFETTPGSCAGEFGFWAEAPAAH
jgi:hypothetical protein